MSEVADQMIALTAQINPLIERAEHALARLGYTVAAMVEADGLRLGFQKVASGWRLVVYRGEEIHLLHTCSRADRIVALAHLGLLHTRLIEMASSQVNEMRAVLETATGYVEQLERMGR